MLTLEGIGKTYKNGSQETIALKHIDLQIKEGEFVSIMGPSGCGKSSLLHILGMLDTPSNGHYRFKDTDVFSTSTSSRVQLRKQHIGFVFQSFNLIDELTVFENIALPLYYLKVPKNERRRRVYEVMERLGLMHRSGHFPKTLSGGQQQRVAVARAIVSEPELILADEPTGNLDSINGNSVMELLAELNEAGTTVVMVTHSSHDASYSKRVIQLLDGDIISENILVHD